MAGRGGDSQERRWRVREDRRKKGQLAMLLRAYCGSTGLIVPQPAQHSLKSRRIVTRSAPKFTG